LNPKFLQQKGYRDLVTKSGCSQPITAVKETFEEFFNDFSFLNFSCFHYSLLYSFTLPSCIFNNFNIFLQTSVE